MSEQNAPVSLAEVKQELNTIVGDTETLNQLVKTTFKGLQVEVAKEAMMEAMIRGFKLDDFLKKNVYAVPFSNGYSLITSIDYARKIGMKSGIVGVEEAEYDMSEDGKTIISCAVTVKKMFDGGHIGDFTARVYFKEYNTGKQQWQSKPMTMIAKVAEMHALRKACPEELSQAYDEAEMQKDTVQTVSTAEGSYETVDDADVSDWKDQLDQAGDQEALQAVWINVPAPVKSKLKAHLTTLMKKFEDVQTEDTK